MRHKKIALIAQGKNKKGIILDGESKASWFKSQEKK